MDIVLEREGEESFWGLDDAWIFDVDAGHSGEEIRGVKVHHCTGRARSSVPLLVSGKVVQPR